MVTKPPLRGCAPDLDCPSIGARAFELVGLRVGGLGHERVGQGLGAPGQLATPGIEQRDPRKVGALGKQLARKTRDIEQLAVGGDEVELGVDKGDAVGDVGEDGLDHLVLWRAKALGCSLLADIDGDARVAGDRSSASLMAVTVRSTRRCPRRRADRSIPAVRIQRAWAGR